MDIKKRVLITGAGFTKNFGGFLASEMWSVIFNHPFVQKNEVLRADLFSRYNYEEVYESVMYQNHLFLSENEQKDMRQGFGQVLFNAYEKLDEIVRVWVFRSGSPYPVNHYKVDAFLNQFAGNKKDGVGFIFTLNQDLFFERKYINGAPFFYPGIKYPNRLNEASVRDSKLTQAMHITIPDQYTDAQRESELKDRYSFYIKLHGSFNWLDQGKRLIITGQRKLESIKGNGLLNWYWNILQDVLNQEDVKVIFIGYSFGDQHLNKIIEKAVFEKNLKIFIISPQPFIDFYRMTKTNGFARVLEKGLAGYFPTDFLGLFPEDQSETLMFRDIEDVFFK